MSAATRTPDAETLTIADQYATEFRQLCQDAYPHIPEAWRNVISRILSFRITWSEQETAQSITARLLSSDGLDLMNWRLQEHGATNIRRCLPDNWPQLEPDGLIDFIAALRLEDQPQAAREVIQEAMWQLRCTPLGENLLQETARQHGQMLLDGQDRISHDHLVVIQMGLMCSEQPRHTRRYTMSFAHLPWQQRLAHYSNDRITAIDPSRLGQHTAAYTTGFWVSVQGPEDCAAVNDRLGLMSTDVHHRVTVDDANILIVATPEAVCDFIERYIDDRLRLAWGKLCGHYDGVIWVQDDPATAETLAHFRKILGHELPEANTGVIWNTAAVTSITPTED